MGTNDPDHSLAELERGLGDTPAYVEWRRFDPGGGASVDARYAALPITTKEILTMAAPRALVPNGRDLDGALTRGEAELIRTSGTTGPPTSLVWSQQWWDASERAAWSVRRDAADLSPGTYRECVLASGRCVGPPPMPDRALTTAERTMGRLLFLNEEADVARWSDDAIHQMADELAQQAPAVLEADPSYLAAFCARAEQLGLSLHAPRLIVLTYGRPSRLHLARIARALPVPMASSYGSTETGYVFLSCERGTLHQNVASCRVEVMPLLEDARIVKLIVTPFGHPWMCLLRFDVGDLARPATAPCPCGRTAGLALDDIEGRVEDATLATDGRLITAAALDATVGGSPSAEQIVLYQIDQPAPGELHLRAVATGPFDATALAGHLRATYGPGSSITVDRVEALEPRPSGKYPYVRRRFTPQLDDRFGPARTASR
jgi:phenylacetate-CoA ligase